MTVDLSSLGWDETFASSYARFACAHHRPARVARVDRGICTLLDPDGASRASIGGGLLAAAAKDPARLPCAGDWVVVREWPDHCATIETVLPRRTAIVRATAGAAATAQVLAANVDTAAVVASVDPEPDLGRIERLLALAWESGAQPLVIVTKVDLAAHPDALVEEIREVARQVEVVAVSAVSGAGLDRLRPLVCAGRTLGLLGVSGSGKSTLVNALAGAAVMVTQTIRRADGRGRHTTTFRALVPLPSGGSVLDTPGIRAVGLFDGVTGLSQAFSDIAELSEQCQFPDCRHEREPRCAVREALAVGELTPRRLESWHKLRRELEAELHRQQARQSAIERVARKRPARRPSGSF
ncbi:MAG TPA: ribosome small subunit-dependent GTPase A [Micromonosporaceae bacterium]